MFSNYNSLSIILFYVCHLLITVINGQHYRQSQQPVGPPNQPRQYSGYHTIYTLPDRKTQYYRSYNLNDTGYSEHLYTRPQTYASTVSQPISRQLRNNQGYDGGRDAGEEQELARFMRYRSLPLPVMGPLLPPPMARPVVSPIVTPSVSPNVPRYGPVVPQNQLNYQHGERAQYRSEYSNNAQRQTVNANEVSVPHSYNVRDEPMNRMIDFFSSDFFKSNVKENKLTTVNLFQNTIIGTNITADEAITRANLEKTAGHIFDNGTSDCKPMMTVVKFGNINHPEIIYNPSSVKVLRCPQACFSWQFDCIPVKKTSYNFTAAVYTMEKDKVTREINQFEIVSHTECACQCKTVASCLSSSSLSNKRPKSNFN